jgi:uncharacterized membrane protein YidH (DUF202 family)
MTTPGLQGGRDPGMQPQRTALAWQRTAVSGLLLSLAALGASAHRLASPAGAVADLPALSVLTAVVAAAAAVVAAVDAALVVPRQVTSLARHPASGSLPSAYWRLRLVVVSTVLLALAGALLSAAGLVASVASSGA